MFRVMVQEVVPARLPPPPERHPVEPAVRQFDTVAAAVLSEDALSDGQSGHIGWTLGTIKSFRIVRVPLICRARIGS